MLRATDPDRYWADLRRQWLLAADRINLNCGSVGCTPLARHSKHTIVDLAVEAAIEAIEDAGLARDDIDGYVGTALAASGGTAHVEGLDEVSSRLMPGQPGPRRSL